MGNAVPPAPVRARARDRLAGVNDSSSSRVLVGTAGYNYPEWRGTFYPEKFSTDKMLAYYAERFPTVEINYTFYRMPNEKLLAGWSAGTPEHFSFTLKAPRRITHDFKLQRCEELTQEPYRGLTHESRPFVGEDPRHAPLQVVRRELEQAVDVERVLVFEAVATRLIPPLTQLV